jgi:hypothetical protein
MQKLNDLSRSFAVLEPDVTLIAVIEMSLSLFFRSSSGSLAMFAAIRRASLIAAPASPRSRRRRASGRRRPSRQSRR